MTRDSGASVKRYESWGGKREDGSHTARRLRLPFNVKLEWHRYVHFYPSSPFRKRYVNQFSVVRDAKR